VYFSFNAKEKTGILNSAGISEIFITNMFVATTATFSAFRKTEI
jgi:hypothetical protein